MARARRNQVFICFGYIPGVTRLVARPATTPECEPHTPQPTGYVEASEWAEEMARTHDQRRCAGCGLWAIWEPNTYLEHGQPVTLLARAAVHRGTLPGGTPVKAAPVNVLIQRDDGTRVVRPFRGLRRKRDTEDVGRNDG